MYRKVFVLFGIILSVSLLLLAVGMGRRHRPERGVTDARAIESSDRAELEPPPFSQIQGSRGAPWQRLLQGEEARMAAEQEKRLLDLLESGKFKEALKVAEALEELRRRVQGADHWQAVDVRRRLKGIHRVLRAKKEEQQNYSRTFAWRRMAEALVATGRYRDAQPFLEQVLMIRSKVMGEEHPDTAESYNGLAAIQNAQGKYKKAEEGLRRALAIRRRVLGEEHPDTAASYNNVASNLNAQGKYVEAEEAYRQGLAIQRKVLGEEHRYTATSYANLATNQDSQGKYREAEESIRQALAIQRKLLGEEHPDTAADYYILALNMATSYDILALNQGKQGKHQEAEDGHRKALAISRKVLGEEHPNTAISYNNLALNQNAQGKYREAEEGFRKALAIKRKVLGEEHPSTATSYDNLALNQSNQGKYREAEETCLKALAIFREVLGEEHPDTATCYNNLAANQDAQGKHKDAEKSYRQALAISRKVLGEEHPNTAIRYNNLAANQSDQGNYGDAEESYRQALAIYRRACGEEHPLTASGFNNLATHQSEQGRYRDAEENYHQALAICRRAYGEEHPLTAKSYRALATNQYSQGKYGEAEKLLGVAATSFAGTRLHIASSGLERTTKTSEDSPLPQLASILARHGKLVEAWQRFEESLARGTWDDLTARLRRSDAELAKQTQLVSRIDRFNNLIEITISVQQPTPEQTKQREELLTQLRQTQDELAAFTRQLEATYGPVAGQVLKRKEIQVALPADAALLGWLDIAGQPEAADPNGEHWVVLLRSSGEPIWVRLHGSGDKDAWTDADTQLPAELRDALQKPRGQWQPLAQRLRQQRLQPLAKHLEGVRQLIVLPSTALAGVPVEVIADGYTVSYAHSGSMYAHLRQQKSPLGKGLFLLADPVFETPDRGGDGDWKRLPGTRGEAAALQRLFAKNEPASVLLDSEASEQRLNELAQSGELGKYRYVHLATHGEVDNVFPLRSAVILSRDHLPDDKQRTELLLSGRPIADGRLTAEEVLRRWNLHCDLVTLSACQTALGKYERGEGFVGFAQAFVLSGSRSVCLTLWEVDDTATALLMERFYQNLLGRREGLDKPMAKSAALAEAKEWLRDLPRSEVVKRATALREEAARGKRPALPPLEVPIAAVEAKEARPFAHPYYWAAFVLVGHAD